MHPYPIRGITRQQRMWQLASLQVIKLAHAGRNLLLNCGPGCQVKSRSA